MYPDPLLFPTIPGEPLQPSRTTGPAAGESAFAEVYSEAIQTANQEMSQILSADADSTDDSAGSFDFASAVSTLNVGSPFGAVSTDFPAVHDNLMQQIAAIRAGRSEFAQRGSAERQDAMLSSQSATATPVSAVGQGMFSSGIHRLISWLDTHAHLHSTHHCAASVRQAMEAAGFATADRPASGDAGDYGPFLLRHGAQVVPQESYQPHAGDIAVFDRTADHPAGHIQVFDGQRWVSDFVQSSFSPYRDEESTPAVTVYRLS